MSVKRALILVMHQVLATMGVVSWALLLTSIAFGIPRLWGHFFRMSDTRRVLLAAPYYPVQIGFSLPFYAAVSYAIGAWLALRFPIRSRLSNKIVDSAVIAIGILILANTVWEAIGDLFYYQQWPWWAVLLGGALEASMGACLILFGIRMRRVEATS
jgi:hypothetical protein